MEALIIIGIVLIVIAFAMAFFSDLNMGSKGTPAAAVIILYVGIMLFAAGLTFTTFKDALDSNPYKKEYTYKQRPDGTMEKYDSIYVRIKK